MIEKYTWVLLCRVSTKKQEKEWNSLERQEKRWKEFAKYKWIKILKIFKETFSGKVDDRTQTEEAIQFAIKNKANYLIIPEIDRLTRSWPITYLQMKKRLEKHKIKLIDTNHIIQWSTLVYENDLVDMSQYSWNKEDSSIYAEVMMATQAEIEWRKILVRMITSEIELEQQWYQVRGAKYGFKNKKIKFPDRVKVIQVPNPPYYWWLVEMFEARAKGILSDKEIIDTLNVKWACKKSWKPLDVQYMLNLIWNPIYAWILRTKWTWWKFIKTPYEMLPIDLWNKANRGRFFIHKNWDEIILEKNIDIRNKVSDNIKEEFIFRGLLKYEWRSMTPYITKNNIYYRSWRLVKPPLNISEKKLLKIFDTIIAQYTLSDENIKYIEVFVEQFKKEESLQVEKRVNELEKEVKKLNEENKEIVRKNIKWLISDEIMKEIVWENESALEKVNSLIIKEKSKKLLNNIEVVELAKFLLNSKEIWQKANKFQKKELLRMIVVELSLTKEKELIIAETKLFKLFKNLHILKWYTWQGSNLRPLA